MILYGLADQKNCGFRIGTGFSPCKFKFGENPLFPTNDECWKSNQGNSIMPCKHQANDSKLSANTLKIESKNFMNYIITLVIIIGYF